MDGVAFEILTLIIGLLAGGISGYAIAHRAIVSKLNRLDRESGENKSEITAVRNYANGINNSVKECHAMHAQAIKLITESIAQNREVLSQNREIMAQNKILIAKVVN